MIENNNFKLYESPMYKSPKKTFKEFYDYIIKNPKCKKCYFKLNNYNIRIPSDTILHDFNKHMIEYENWLDFFENIENIKNASISKETKGSSLAEMYLCRVKGKYDYGCSLRLEPLYTEITILFIDHKNTINNWIKTATAGGLTSQLSASDTSKGSSVTQPGQLPINIINHIKQKIKSNLDEDEIFKLNIKLERLLNE